VSIYMIARLYVRLADRYMSWAILPLCSHALADLVFCVVLFCVIREHSQSGGTGTASEPTIPGLTRSATSTSVSVSADAVSRTRKGARKCAPRVPRIPRHRIVSWAGYGCRRDALSI
jgi:hypothetical protein